MLLEATQQCNEQFNVQFARMLWQAVSHDETSGKTSEKEKTEQARAVDQRSALQ
jgi:hypothetical protein